MEPINCREGQCFHIGPFSIAVSVARGGHLVGFANNLFGETEADVLREARQYRDNYPAVDIPTTKADNLGN